MLQIAFPLAGKQATPPAAALVSSGACNATICTRGLTGPSNSQPASQQMDIDQLSMVAVTLPPAPYTLLPGYVSRPQVHHVLSGIIVSKTIVRRPGPDWTAIHMLVVKMLC